MRQLHPPSNRLHLGLGRIETHTGRETRHCKQHPVGARALVRADGGLERCDEIGIVG
jgi:hypothetical protein